jgi:hypothetical protein
MMHGVLMCYIGELQSVDGYMNIALEQTREFVEGKLRRTYGDAFVRGNNGMMFSIEPSLKAADWTSDVYLCGLVR